MSAPQFAPTTIITADGDKLDLSGALCLTCNESIEDHVCPEPDTETTPPRPLLKFVGRRHPAF